MIKIWDDKRVQKKNGNEQTCVEEEEESKNK